MALHSAKIINEIREKQTESPKINIQIQLDAGDGEVCDSCEFCCKNIEFLIVFGCESNDRC